MLKKGKNLTKKADSCAKLKQVEIHNCWVLKKCF